MAGEKSRNTFTGLTVNWSLLTSQGPRGLLDYAAARLSPAPPHSLTPPLSRPQHLFTTLLSAHFLVHWAWDAPRRQEWILISMCFSLYLPNTCLLSVFLLQVNTFLRWEALLGPGTPVTLPDSRASLSNCRLSFSASSAFSSSQIHSHLQINELKFLSS